MATLPADARRSLFVYNVCFPFVFLALLPGFLLRLLRRGNYRAHFEQRLGSYTAAERARFAQRRHVWIHSISVGETLIALKLARAWRDKEPELTVVLSVTTSTGFALAQEGAGDWMEVVYNPVDLLPIVRRAFGALQPRAVVLIEGEAWPNLLAEAHRRGTAVRLVDARLSPRSERRFRRFRSWTGPIFRLLHSICVPTGEDRERWSALGVSREQIHVTGSIKFDQSVRVTASRAEEFRKLLGERHSDAPIIVAGSTFPGEEKLLAELLPALREKHPGVLLILVPRHVERMPEILRELAPLNLAVAVRTALPSSGSSDVLVVDTTGELRDWYELATVAFVGKSLTAIGGQNPIEPAALAKAIVFGPRMDNFRSIVDHLIASDAAIIAADAPHLRAVLLELLAEPARRAELGRNAANAVAANSGAIERVLGVLQRNEVPRGEIPCLP